MTLHSAKRGLRNGGPDEGMWNSYYLEGMGYECIRGPRPVAWDQITLMLTGVQITYQVRKR